MKTIQLQIEDDYIEEFLNSLPKDKVTLIDDLFLDNQSKFKKELESFMKNETNFKPHLENMKEMDNWLKEAEDANS